MKTRLAYGIAALALALTPAAFAQVETQLPVAPPAEPAPPASTAAPDASATPPAAPETPAAAAPAPTPPLAGPNPISAPPEGKGQIVFFRPSRMVGAALTFTVRENETDLGRLPSGRYFVTIADPGIHEYTSGRNDTIRMEIEAGETYYVQQGVSMGFMAGRATLAPSDAATFQEKALRLSVAD